MGKFLGWYYAKCFTGHFFVPGMEFFLVCQLKSTITGWKIFIICFSSHGMENVLSFQDWKSFASWDLPHAKIVHTWKENVCLELLITHWKAEYGTVWVVQSVWHTVLCRSEEPIVRVMVWLWCDFSKEINEEFHISLPVKKLKWNLSMLGRK